MLNNRLAKLAVAVFLVAVAPALARAEKPEKIPVALGTWKGPHAATFKSGLKRGLRKDCTVVRPQLARAVVNGEVTEHGKGFAVRVIVKTPKTDELVESREYTFSKPSVSQAQSNKMGRGVTEMARRTPAQ